MNYLKSVMVSIALSAVALPGHSAQFNQALPNKAVAQLEKSTLQTVRKSAKNHRFFSPDISALLHASQQVQGSTVTLTLTTGKTVQLSFYSLEGSPKEGALYWIGTVKNDRSSYIRFSLPTDNLLGTSMETAQQQAITG